jgi:beta-phosphoglucomutase-like phosphatase (HAD superfamily)
LLAAERLGIEPSQCVAIEDSAEGVMSARAAGMLSIAVSAPELAGRPAPDADLIVPDRSEQSAVEVERYILSRA